MKQLSEEWYAARLSLITATDIPVILGLSPYKCEADLADEKNGAARPDPSLRMRVGQAVQDLIGEEYAAQTGRRVQRVKGLRVSSTIPWAAASPDFRVVGERRLVEAKRNSSRVRFVDGLPQDVEAQVAWQLGVTGYERADVAVLMYDDDLKVFEMEADPALFANLVTVAEDFRRRLEAGGPFARDHNRIKRDHPTDDGSEMIADDELEQAANALLSLRIQRKEFETAEERIEDAIKARMGDASALTGAGFRITWRQTKPVEQTDWRSVADGLLRQLPETEAQGLVGIHTSARPGFRPFRLIADKETP